MKNIFPIILAGGRGRRLYPLSSENKPKQFLKINSDDSLYQQTFSRALEVASLKNIITVGQSKYTKTITKQAAKIDSDFKSNFIFEPCLRNTAAAIVIGAIHAYIKNPDAIILSMPSDHIIKDSSGLVSAIRKSTPYANDDQIVCFGVEPTREDGNYGHIIAGNDLSSGLSTVRTFVEKPSAKKLARIVENGKYYWNSGIYLFAARKLIRVLKESAPEFLQCIEKSFAYGNKGKFGFEPNEVYYDCLDSIAIDNLVMEQAADLMVCPIDIGWSDVGSWHAIWEMSQAEGNDNPLSNFLNMISKAA